MQRVPPLSDRRTQTFPPHQASTINRNPTLRPDTTAVDQIDAPRHMPIPFPPHRMEMYPEPSSRSLKPIPQADPSSRSLKPIPQADPSSRSLKHKRRRGTHGTHSHTVVAAELGGTASCKAHPAAIASRPSLRTQRRLPRTSHPATAATLMTHCSSSQANFDTHLPFPRHSASRERDAQNPPCRRPAHLGGELGRIRGFTLCRRSRRAWRHPCRRPPSRPRRGGCRRP